MTQYLSTIAPIPGETMKEYFKNKEVVFLISLEDTLLSPETLLLYISNINLPIEITFKENLPYQDFETLILTYMESQHIIESLVLRDYVSLIILRFLKVESPFSSILPDSYIDTFIEKNKTIIEKWIMFLDSSVISIIYSNPTYLQDYPVDTLFEVIDDDSFVGLNICNQYLSRDFISLFESLDREVEKQYVFKAQCQKPLFNNNTITPYITQSFNPISKATEWLVNGSMLFKEKSAHTSTEEHINQLKQEAMSIVDKFYSNKK